MSTTAINVNLAKCDDGLMCVSSDDECPACSILIPCPIPRSVTFEVRLGECAHPCTARISFGEHWAQCHARTVKVSCSISGKTWEESEVVEVEARASVSAIVSDALPVPCRERWVLVKALVLGSAANPSDRDASWELFRQRDAVYAALADMARAEQAEFREWLSLPDEVKRKCQTDPPDIEHERTPAVESLAAYVEHLIEQIGMLP